MIPRRQFLVGKYALTIQKYLVVGGKHNTHLRGQRLGDALAAHQRKGDALVRNQNRPRAVQRDLFDAGQHVFRRGLHAVFGARFQTCGAQRIPHRQRKGADCPWLAVDHHCHRALEQEERQHA